MTLKERKNAFLIARIPLELKERLKKAAQEKKMNLSVLVRDIIEKFLK